MKRMLMQQMVERDRREKVKRGLLRVLRSMVFLKRFVWIPCVATLLLLFGIALKASPLFTVQSVEVVGDLKYLSVPEVMASSKIKTGEPLLSLSLKTIKKNVAALKWVRTVSVRREIPSRVWIAVEEEQPSALLLSDQLYFLSKEGAPFKNVGTERYRNLPVISGTSNREEIVEALAILSQVEREREMDLFGLSEIHFDPVLGYSLVTLSGPMEIVLGRSGIDDKIARLKILWSTYGQRLGKVRGIDLDYEDRAFVKL